MVMEKVAGKSLEEIARGSQILDTPYNSTIVYELGTLIRNELYSVHSVSISTSNSSGTVLDKGESSIASSIQVTIEPSKIRNFVQARGITQPDFVAMVGDIVHSGMLFSTENVTIDRYNVSSLYDEELTISIDFAYTKVTDFDGGKDVAKKNSESLKGLTDKVNNLSDLVQKMDTGFGTEVANLQEQVDALDTPKEVPDEPVPSDTKVAASDESVPSDTKVAESTEVEAETSPVTNSTGGGTSEA